MFSFGRVICPDRITDEIAIAEAIAEVETELKTQKRSRGSSFHQFIINKGAEIDIDDIEEEFIEIANSSAHKPGEQRATYHRSDEGL
jgi:hypothetical protein